MDEAMTRALEMAARDEAATQLREEFGEALAAALRVGGQMLWIGGSMLGPDRAEGKSPFDFGKTPP